MSKALENGNDKVTFADFPKTVNPLSDDGSDIFLAPEAVFDRIQKKHSTEHAEESRSSRAVSMKNKLKGSKVWMLGNSNVPLRQRRYCGKRIGFCGFICLNICCFLTVLLIILIPVMLCVGIPQMIQQRFDQVVSSGAVPSLAFSAPQNPAYNIHIDTQLPQQSIVPGVATIPGPTTIYLADQSQPQNPWANLVVSDINVPINQACTVSFDGRVNINGLPPFSSMLNGFTSMNYVVLVSTNVNIKFWGIQWYSNLPLRSHIDLNSQSGRQLLNFLQPSALGSTLGNTIGGVTQQIPQIPSF